MFTCFHCGEPIRWKKHRKFWVHTNPNNVNNMRCYRSAATDLFYAGPDARGSTLPEYLERTQKP